jgi:hypothetical protein
MHFLLLKVLWSTIFVSFEVDLKPRNLEMDKKLSGKRQQLRKIVPSGGGPKFWTYRDEKYIRQVPPLPLTRFQNSSRQAPLWHVTDELILIVQMQNFEGSGSMYELYEGELELCAPGFNVVSNTNQGGSKTATPGLRFHLPPLKVKCRDEDLNVIMWRGLSIDAVPKTS